tara:strand:- start:334 stop:696 length:363 start_codon:yes stop_codon:yes gene_type:complete
MSLINNDRHRVISDKLLKMAQALMTEGEESGDYIIQSTANFIMLLSGIMNNPKDIRTVSELLAMFSAKKVLDDQIMSQTNSSELEEIFKNMRDSLKKDYNDDNDEDEYYDDDDNLDGGWE